MGVVNDKDLDKVLLLFLMEVWYYFVKVDIFCGLLVDDLKVVVVEYNFCGDSYVFVSEVLLVVKVVVEFEDLIFVGGSIFIVVEVL